MDQQITRRRVNFFLLKDGLLANLPWLFASPRTLVRCSMLSLTMDQKEGHPWIQYFTPLTMNINIFPRS